MESIIESNMESNMESKSNMKYNPNGLKYFMHILTDNNEKDKNYLLLNRDLRQLIWNHAHDYPYISCYICKSVLINFKINIYNNLYTDNISIINGICKCNNCIQTNL